jgi:hypothetical protein
MLLLPLVPIEVSLSGASGRNTTPSVCPGLYTSLGPCPASPSCLTFVSRCVTLNYELISARGCSALTWSTSVSQFSCTSPRWCFVAVRPPRRCSSAPIGSRRASIPSGSQLHMQDLGAVGLRESVVHSLLVSACSVDQCENIITGTHSKLSPLTR